MQRLKIPPKFFFKSTKFLELFDFDIKSIYHLQNLELDSNDSQGFEFSISPI